MAVGSIWVEWVGRKGGGKRGRPVKGWGGCRRGIHSRNQRMASVECVPFNIAEHYISSLLSLSSSPPPPSTSPDYPSHPTNPNPHFSPLAASKSHVPHKRVQARTRVHHKFEGNENLARKKGS